MHNFIRILLLAVAIGADAYAYPKDHGPFPPGEEPARVALTKCALVRRPGGDPASESAAIREYAPAQTSAVAVLRMRTVDQGDHWIIELRDSRGAQLCAPATNHMDSYGITVYSADLNRDARPDFVVNVWSGGCGLAAEGSETTFLLSGGGTYAADTFYSYDFGPEDFITLKPHGPCYFIDNDVMSNGDEKTKDGRNHNFWVYELHRFGTSRMVRANGDDPRFPRWVWYTFKPNHRETDQLTTQQKTRLLSGRGDAQ